jgi:tripartite motif-containing protein 71
VILLAAACAGSSSRAQSAESTSGSTGPTARPSSPPGTPEFAVHLAWSVKLAPPPPGIDFVVDAVAEAGDGTVYVIDAVKHTVLHYDAGGRLIGTWGRAGRGQGEFDFQRASETVLISGIAVDRSGDVWVAEPGNARIQEFDGAGRFVKIVGGPESPRGGFVRVIGVSVDGHGSVYATDADGRDPIQKFDGSGRFVGAWGGTGAAGRRISNEGAAPAAVSAAGIVYAPDNDASNVVVFDSNGAIRSSFGSQPAADGGMSHPGNAAVSDAGIVYVADTGNNRICGYSKTGRFLGATSGAAKGPGRFQGVGYVAARTPGHLFVIDDSRSLLLAFTTTGPSTGGR